MESLIDPAIASDITHALDGLVERGWVGALTPWRLPDGAQIGWQVFSRQAHSPPLSIDFRPPHTDAVCHPDRCPQEAGDLYRLHARLYGAGCGAACLDDAGSVAGLMAQRLAPPLAACLEVDEQQVVEALFIRARLLPEPASSDLPPARVIPLADVLFA